MKVSLNHDWLGHPAGSELNLHTEVAEILIDRGTASSVGGGESGRRPRDKAMTAPPENKMFSGQSKKTKSDDDII